MTFALRWIRREWRNDRAWAALFVLSLSLGLFGFVTLESFRQALERTLRSHAREFLSADFALSSRRALSASEIEGVREQLRPTQESRLTEMFSMAASPGGSRLVQLKAIDAAYPLYGKLKLGSHRVITRDGSGELQSAARVWIYPELLSQLKIKVGDRLKLGSLEFEVADTVEDDSTQTFRLGGLAPKIYLGKEFLPKTGLIGLGTTLSDVVLFRIDNVTDDQLLELERQLQIKYPDPNLQFATPMDSAEDTARSVQTLLDYLGLVSLVGLALGLVGVGYLLQLFLSRRIASLGMLRTLGLTSAETERLVMLELAGGGLMATVLVALGAAGGLPLLGAALADLLPIPLDLRLAPVTLVWALLLSTLLPLLVAWPLVRPLRRLDLKQVLLDREAWRGSLRGAEWLTWLPAALVYFGMSVWISHSLKTASMFCGALIGSAVVVLFFSRTLLRALPTQHGPWLWRSAALRLSRTPARFSVVVLALSFGTLLLTLLPQIRASLRAELASPESSQLPSLFLFDIQDEQLAGVQALVRARGLEPQNVSPLIRSRILSVNGQPFDRAEKKTLQSREEETEARFRNRGVNLTTRAQLSDSEELAAGAWFDPTPGPIAQLSVEKKYAERLGIQIGDQLQFDIQGVEISGQVRNLRTVRWNSFRPNFFITFQPGFLEDAPKIWLMSLPGQTESAKAGLQESLVAQFPNVSIVDVARVIDKVLEITDQMTAALTGMAFLSVLVGLFVLLTVLLIESRARVVEWNLYKVLGASPGFILRQYLLESVILSATAVVLGAALGLGLSAALMRWLFSAPLTLSPEFLALGIASPFVLSGVLSWQLGRRLLRTPASSLLAEARI